MWRWMLIVSAMPSVTVHEQHHERTQEENGEREQGQDMDCVRCQKVHRYYGNDSQQYPGRWS